MEVGMHILSMILNESQTTVSFFMVYFFLIFQYYLN